MSAEEEAINAKRPSEFRLPDNTTRFVVGMVTIVGTVLSSNGLVDFRAMERNEELLKTQQVRIEHIDTLISEIRKIHDQRTKENKQNHIELVQLLDKHMSACK